MASVSTALSILVLCLQIIPYYSCVTEVPAAANELHQRPLDPLEPLEQCFDEEPSCPQLAKSGACFGLVKTKASFSSETRDVETCQDGRLDGCPEGGEREEVNLDVARRTLSSCR